MSVARGPATTDAVTALRVAPRRRAPWHLVYFALAAFDLIAVASGLYLSHRLMQIYTSSVTENQVWAQRLASFHRLNDLAAAANAPGNDVFDSKDAAAERSKRDSELAAFRSHLAKLESDIETNVGTELRPQLRTAVADISAAMDSMIELADLVFDLFASDQGERAGEHMATMDRRYGDVTRFVSAATGAIQEIQSELFREQLADAAKLKRFEYAIGLLIVLMVGCVTLYGHKIQKVMAADQLAVATARAEAELNEARFRDFAASASDWYWETDAEHRFTYISPGAERFFDVDRRMGRSRSDVAAETAEMREQMARHRADLEARRPFRDFEFTSRIAGEEARVFLASGNPIFAPDGSFLGYRGVGRDVTALHDSNRRLAIALEREREVAAQQRRFISITAHEFRTPLTIIDGAAQRLLRDTGRIDVEDLQLRATRIRQAAARMGQIVDRTLNSARIDEGRIELRRERVDLVELMREIGQRQEATSSGFEIAIASAAPSLEVDADRQLLDQVFTNLLSNAVKYSAASRHVDVALAVDGGNVRVTVRDFGVGIPAHELPRLFTRFYRASTAQGISGTGIGLSLVKDLLAMHGGSVSATSRVGEGSVFVVTLPMSSAAALGARSA